jgi:hypothetical protein
LEKIQKLAMVNISILYILSTGFIDYILLYNFEIFKWIDMLRAE